MNENLTPQLDYCKPVFLCGFMGCGKSTVGKKLSKLTGFDFVDLDRLIEQTQGKSIPEIFSEKGEEYFRRLESDAIKGFSGKVIVALGGGAILQKENAAAAKAQGAVVYIYTRFETCYRRISGDSRRPLAAGSTRAELLERYKKRASVYEKAATVTVKGNSTPKLIAEEICQKLNSL